MLQKIGLECIEFSMRLQKFRYGSGFTTQILAILLCKLLNLHKITRGAAIIAPLCPRRFLYISANIANCIPLLAHVIASNLLWCRGWSPGDHIWRHGWSRGDQLFCHRWSGGGGTTYGVTERFFLKPFTLGVSEFR